MCFSKIEKKLRKEEIDELPRQPNFKKIQKFVRTSFDLVNVQNYAD